MRTLELKELAKEQGVNITTSEAKKWDAILSIVNEHDRNLTKRLFELNTKGFYTRQQPMKTGAGVGTCIKRMHNGNLRIRVSANWCSNFGNYAHCVTI